MRYKMIYQNIFLSAESNNRAHEKVSITKHVTLHEIKFVTMTKQINYYYAFD